MLQKATHYVLAAKFTSKTVLTVSIVKKARAVGQIETVVAAVVLRYASRVAKRSRLTTSHFNVI